MRCPKCGSEHVAILIESKVYIKHRGCLAWCLWILLAVCTFGIILIIPLITNSKTVSKNKKVALCQNCACKWNV